VKYEFCHFNQLFVIFLEYARNVIIYQIFELDYKILTLNDNIINILLIEEMNIIILINFTNLFLKIFLFGEFSFSWTLVTYPCNFLLGRFNRLGMIIPATSIKRIKASTPFTRNTSGKVGVGTKA
jgi:hypothetical protein